jgi:hypothetical protein
MLEEKPVATWNDDGRVVVRMSMKRMLLFCAGSALATAGCGALAFGLAVPNEDAPPQWVAFIGFAVMGLSTLALGFAMLKLRGDVVTVSPEGIRDIRLSPDLIPWSAVEGVTWRRLARDQETIVLALDKSFEDTLRLPRVAQWGRNVDHAFGLDGLPIVVGPTLTMKFGALLAIVERYYAKYGKRPG